MALLLSLSSYGILAVARADRPPETLPILLAWGSLDPLSPPAAGGFGRFAPSPDGRALYLVQLHGPVREEAKAQLASVGARIHRYLPHFAFLATLDVEHVGAARGLPEVRAVVPYEPAYRVAARLLRQATGPADAAARLDLRVLAVEPEHAAAVAEGLRSLGAEVGRPVGAALRAILPPGRLAEAAALPWVEYIEERQPLDLHNDVARGIAGVTAVSVTLGYTGTGQIVAMADTGLDTGVTDTLRPDFSGRISAAYAISAPDRPITGWPDYHGHGTHLAGTMVGTGVSSTGQYVGAAPGASLIFQSIGPSGSLYLQDDIGVMFAQAYTEGARIHSNGWGAGVYGSYDSLAEQADRFAWQHPDMLLLFSAGNRGTDDGGDGLVDLDSIASPGTAKNPLTVGSAESLRPAFSRPCGTTWGACASGVVTFPSAPVVSDALANNPGGLAGTSSRGPTDDGRIKPDLVAPGTAIASVASSLATAVVTSNLWLIHENPAYAYHGGSSTATALAAGSAALVRQYYTQTRSHEPSAALVKATLINGAADLTPGQFGSGLVTTTAVYTTGFESEVTSTWILTGWAVTTTNPHSGSAALATGPYTTSALLTATLSATIPLTGVVSPTLTFWTHYDMDRSVVEDFGWVDVMTDTSAGWVPVARLTSSLSAWTPMRVSLLPFTGALGLRFRLEGGPNLPGGDGWWIDDVSVGPGLGVQEVEGRPDYAQGWGRLNLTTTLALEPPTQLLFVDARQGITAGATSLYSVTVTDTTRPVSFTLAWTDYPASPAAAVALVNDLDLTVKAPNGTVYYPNGLSAADRRNNVEWLVLVPPVAGDYLVQVAGYNVPFGPQPYALVAHGNVTGMVTASLPFRLYLPLVVKAYAGGW